MKPPRRTAGTRPARCPAAATRLAAALLWLVLGGNAGAADSLLFLTWADYLDPALAEEFERETGIAVEFAYYESDDHRDEMLADSDGRGYDLVLVNGLMLSTYAQRNWLAPMPFDALPELAHIDPRWRTAYPAAERYGAAYFWGSLGIGYRRDLVPDGFPSWMDFFAPAEPLRGRISMLKSSRDVVAMALKALGHSVNTDDREQIRAAGDLLVRQQPYVRSYEYVQLGDESALVKGEVWASLMYSGDALMVQEHHEDIAYAVPREGTILWVDYLAILQQSPRRDLAARFVAFLNRPDVAARNAEFVHYASPNAAARELLPAEFLADPVIHPDQDVMARSETFRELSPRAQKTLNTVFSQVTR